MGICISVASAEIHEAQDGQEDVVVRYIESSDSNVKQRGASLYSKTGSKGLNQDAAILYQGFGLGDGAFCAVFDGHGKNGHIISQTVRDQLPPLLLSQKNVLAKNISAENENFHQIDTEMGDDRLVLENIVQKWQDACVTAFKVMDKEIKLQENLDCSTSGTTAVAAIRQEEDLIIANLGDSRAILGTLAETGIVAVQLTTDLKPGLPHESDRIRQCNGRVLALKEEPHIQRVWLPHENMPGLAMSRAFGDFLLKDYGVIAIPDFSYHRLAPNDKFIVLATDGVWDVLTNDQVASIVWETRNGEAAAKLVVDAANATWQQKFPSSKVDDCTVICYFFHEIKKCSLPV